MHRNNKQLTLQDKIDIIKRLEDGEKGKDICKIYNIGNSTISKIKRNKSGIEKFSQNSIRQAKNIQRMRKAYFPEVERLLYDWFLEQRIHNAIITNDILILKATEFHQSLNTDIPFQASIGWVQKFKIRHCIRSLKICGEKLSANYSSTGPFVENFNQIIQDLHLCPEQIYNVDETALIYKNLINRTLVGKHEKCAAGRTQSKDKLTIMPCTNASGQHKLPLMIIGKIFFICKSIKYHL